MAVTSGHQAQLMLDEFNLHQFARQFSAEPTVDLHDASVLGTTSRIKQSGIKHATAASELFSDSDNAAFDILKAKYGAGTAAILTYAPLGFTVGNPAILMYLHEVSFNTRSVVDDLNLLTFNAEAAEDAADFGVSLHAHAAETATGNSTSVDNTAATTNGGVATIHVSALSGTGSPTLTPKVQHSVDNSVWVDLVSFTALTAVGKQRVEVAPGTTINRYLRETRTISGTTPSFTFTVSFARR